MQELVSPITLHHLVTQFNSSCRMNQDQAISQQQNLCLNCCCVSDYTVYNQDCYFTLNTLAYDFVAIFTLFRSLQYFLNKILDFISPVPHHSSLGV